MKKRFNFLFIIFFFLPVSGLYAAEGTAGVSGYDFLKIISLPRNEALGGILGPASGGAQGIFGNAGGLHLAGGWEATAAHTEWIEGVRVENLAFTKNLTKKAALGIAAGFLYMEAMTEITEEKGGAYPGKYLETGKTFNANDIIGLAGCSFGFGSRLLLGITGKYIRESIKDYTTLGFGADAGVTYTARNIKLTLLAMNLGQIDGRYSLPAEIRLGAAYWNKKLGTSIFAEAGKYLREGLTARAGAEFRVIDEFVLRAGYIHRFYETKTGEPGLTAGFGINIDDIRIDYSYRPAGIFGTTHRISLTFSKRSGHRKSSN